MTNEQLTKFIDAANEVYPSNLTDEQLKRLSTLCHDLALECDREIYKRGL